MMRRTQRGPDRFLGPSMACVIRSRGPESRPGPGTATHCGQIIHGVAGARSVRRARSGPLRLGPDPCASARPPDVPLRARPDGIGEIVKSDRDLQPLFALAPEGASSSSTPNRHAPVGGRSDRREADQFGLTTRDVDVDFLANTDGSSRSRPASSGHRGPMRAHPPRFGSPYVCRTMARSSASYR